MVRYKTAKKIVGNDSSTFKLSSFNLNVFQLKLCTHTHTAIQAVLPVKVNCMCLCILFVLFTLFTMYSLFLLSFVPFCFMLSFVRCMCYCNICFPLKEPNCDSFVFLSYINFFRNVGRNNSNRLKSYRFSQATFRLWKKNNNTKKLDLCQFI